MNEIYEKNMDVIKKISAVFSKELEEAPTPDWLTLVNADNGKRNFTVFNAGRVQAAYDQKDPIKDVKKSIKNFTYLNGHCSILIGVGLGYTLNEILKKKEKKHIVAVIEPNFCFFREAFKNFDFTKYLENGTLLLFDGKKESTPSFFGMIESKWVIQQWFLMAEKYTYFKTDLYADIVQNTMEMINSIQCNVGTVIHAGTTIAKNDILNVPYVFRNTGVVAVKDMFKDVPAVLVSTGPSLQKNIHILQENKDKVLIIAVAQCLRVLLAYDIVPDFITTVDYGKTNEEHFKGLWDTDTTLVCLNRTYAPILKQWKGRKLITVSKYLENESVVGLMQHKGYLEQGGSVSHLNVGLALHLGCDPICIIGQDLAYDGEHSHIPLVDAGGKITEKEDGTLSWDINDPHSHLKGKPYGMGMAKVVPGYFGKPVKTNMGLASFITSFEQIFLTYKEEHTFINSTEGGASIKGTTQMSLKDFIADYGCDLDKSSIKKIPEFIDDPRKLALRLIKAFNKEIRELYELIKYAEDGLGYSDKILSEKGKIEFKMAVAKNREMSNKAHKIAATNQLMGMWIYEASRAIESRELKVSASTKHLFKDRKDLETRVKRNRLILEAAKTAAEEMIELYEESLGLLKEYRDTDSPDILVSYIYESADLQDIDDYFHVGNWAHPYLEAKKLIENSDEYYDGDIDYAYDIRKKAIWLRSEATREAKEAGDNSDLIHYNQLIMEAQVLGREERNFMGSLEKLKEAEVVNDSGEEAIWGIGSAYYQLKKFEKAAEKYEKLILLFPENNRYQFEYGQVLLNIDMARGLEVLQKVFEKTDEFDSFLFRLAQLYADSELFELSHIAICKYLEKFPDNMEAWLVKAKVLEELDRMEEYQEAMDKYNKMKGVS